VETPQRAQDDTMGVDAPPNGKGEKSQRSWKGRVSLASQALNETLTELPVTPPSFAAAPPVPTHNRNTRSRSAMGPPSGLASGSQSQNSPADSAPSNPSKHVSRRSGPSHAGDAKLGVLKDCTIFVDVRTDEGDDAGSLFAEMLSNMGARVS
jgi:hypothetical protein